MSNEDKQAALSATVDIPLRRFDFTDPDAGGATMGERPDGWWVTYDEAMTHTAAVAAKAVEEATKDMVPLSADAKSVFLDGFGLLDIVYPSAPQQHAQAVQQNIVAYEMHGPADHSGRESPEVRIVFTRKVSDEYVEEGWTLYRELWSSKPTRSFVGEQDVSGHAQAALSDAEPSELEAVIACLGDDAARLQETEPEVADNMRAAERLLEALATRQPAPVAFVPGGLQALADMTGQPAMYGDTEVLPKAAPVAAAVAQECCGSTEHCERKVCPAEAAPDSPSLAARMAKAGIINDYGYRMLMDGAEIGFDLQTLINIAAIAQRAASKDSERDAALLEKAAQTCDQQADGTNGPYRSACLQCADAVRALRDAAIVGQDVAKGGAE